MKVLDLFIFILLTTQAVSSRILLTPINLMHFFILKIKRNRGWTCIASNVLALKGKPLA